jgi:transcriptional regulator with XRE-family HTH domain
LEQDDIERGRRNPTVKVIWNLAKALDNGPTALFAQAETFEDEGPKKPSG